MKCVEVRDRLTEHELGSLSPDDRRHVERHLEWCAGCRKEAAELAEGAETLALALPLDTPAPALEDRVVHEVLAAAGRRPHLARRRTVRALAVATLVAALLAVAAVGWGFSQRQTAQDLKQEVQRALQTKQGLASLVATVRSQFQTKGTLYEADLYPGLARQQPGGTAVVFAASREGSDGFALVQVLTPLPAAQAPYSVTLVDRDGRALVAGPLGRNQAGQYVLANLTLTQDLSRAGAAELAHLTTLNVVNRSGVTVLTGTFRLS